SGPVKALMTKPSFLLFAVRPICGKLDWITRVLAGLRRFRQKRQRCAYFQGDSAGAPQTPSFAAFIPDRQALIWCKPTTRLRAIKAPTALARCRTRISGSYTYIEKDGALNATQRQRQLNLLRHSGFEDSPALTVQSTD